MDCELLYELYKKSCIDKIKCEKNLIYPITEQIQINNCIKIVKLYYKSCSNKKNYEIQKNNLNMLNHL